MVDDLAQLDLVDADRPSGCARDDPRRDRCGRVLARARPRPHRRASLAAARARRGRDPRARDRRAPGLPSRRPHDVRGADRRAGRCHGLRRRRHPLDAAPFGTGAARPPRGDRRSAARHRPAGVRQRRRHRFARADGIRPRRHRAHRRQRPARRPPLRRLPGVRPGPRRRLRARGRAQAARPTSRRCSAAAGSRSGPPVPSRQPLPVWPGGPDDAAARGRRRGADAAAGRVGARRCRSATGCWFRHAKSGELAERVDRYHLVDGDRLGRRSADATEAKGSRSCDPSGRNVAELGRARRRCVRSGSSSRARRPRCSGRCSRGRARGMQVKAVGAGHSFTGIAVAPGVLLDLTDLTRPGLGRPRPRAGSRLRAGTRLHQIPRLLAPYGLAMPNLGDIDRQSHLRRHLDRHARHRRPASAASPPR